ncbi:aminotransferase class I/II-fold pyridoxal phosphate-dependent enzyme [Massilia sp. TW-1]|uniref:Aminotransferase class I/II-fold pyridoxal phosphate-dependent enzyme n=1 Tax=Telluria antibiotica TaxID=2717319 RepID=A0ABX0P953_9BURK|nr:aminotransferase class I/II-fold pyridoxal phosphate-dependent enzyme [Telluria antibiotica]NIA53204.1 aminotransferase class I/II-fold pyridoxal phosphate-dependent enzyme [Telluria antibiotica]
MHSTTDRPRARRPRIPHVPILSLDACGGGRGGALPSLLDGADVRLVTSGRIAIGLALRALGVGAGDVVLVPAYHSPSMIPPAHWCGAEVAFYRVLPDTAPDLADIEAKLGSGRVKAIIATHFFGIPHDLAPLRALCDRHGIGLVEDCAHAFFGARDGVPVGSTGDYAIGSTMKFFPVYEGGCLVSRRHRLDVALRGASAGFEMKAALNALEAAFAHGRLPVLRVLLALPLRLKGALWNAVKARGESAGTAAGAPTAALAPSSSDSSFEFDPRWTDKRSSRFSRAVLRLSSPTRIVARRRRNYAELQRALDGAPGCRPLFPRLPDGACPWMFPLLVDRPQAVAEALQRAGVPMTRFGATLWPGVDASVCANSADLGRRLIAFPCHQALTDAERAWLHAQVRQALEACAAVPA